MSAHLPMNLQCMIALAAIAMAGCVVGKQEASSQDADETRRCDLCLDSVQHIINAVNSTQGRDLVSEVILDVCNSLVHVDFLCRKVAQHYSPLLVDWFLQLVKTPQAACRYMRLCENADGRMRRLKNYYSHFCISTNVLLECGDDETGDATEQEQVFLCVHKRPTSLRKFLASINTRIFDEMIPTRCHSPPGLE